MSKGKDEKNYGNISSLHTADFIYSRRGDDSILFDKNNTDGFSKRRRFILNNDRRRLSVDCSNAAGFGTYDNCRRIYMDLYKISYQAGTERQKEGKIIEKYAY